MRAPLDSPEKAEAAFYEAFAQSNLEAMMAVWADDERIGCVHPMSPLITGLGAIRESWAGILHGSPGISLRVELVMRVRRGPLAVHTVHEYLGTGGEEPRRPIVATNVYLETEAGWRMIMHHASPSASVAKPETTLH
jgi:ketosteroid isomerase-like protein